MFILNSTGFTVKKISTHSYRIYWIEGDYVTIRNIAEFLIVSAADNYGYKAVDAEVADKCMSILDDKCVIFGNQFIENDGIKISRTAVKDCPSCFIETFIYRIHDIIRPQGAKVLDIGAWVGDSSLRLAKLGAAKIVAVEPNPNNYSELLRHIKLNKTLGNRIIAINAAVGNDGRQRFCYNKKYDGGGSIFKDNEKCINIYSYSIKTLYKKYGYFDIIKLDCKGCEISVLNELHILKPKPKLLKLEVDLPSWGTLIDNDPSKLINKLIQLGYSVQVFRIAPSVKYFDSMYIIASLRNL